jgi:hypothetical protein
VAPADHFIGKQPREASPREANHFAGVGSVRQNRKTARMSAFAGILALAAMWPELAISVADTDQPDRDKSVVVPGTNQDVIVPPNNADPGINKGTPRASEFPTPVIRPPVNPTPMPAHPDTSDPAAPGH